MKKLFFFLVMAFVMMSNKAWSYDFVVNGVYYNINGSEATVTYQSTSYNSYSGDVVVPDAVTYNSVDYSVTAIGEYAFYGSTGMTSVSLPEGIVSIGQYAFSGCTGISSITIPVDVTSVAKRAFENCTNLTSVIYNAAALASAPSGPTQPYMFYGDSHDCELTIGEAVTQLPGALFTGLTRVTTINFNAINCANLSSIGNVWGSKNTEGLTTTLNIGENVETIPAYLFKDYINMTGNVVIPDITTTIGQQAFAGCTGIEGVTIGTGVSTFGSKAFDSCTSLSNIVFNATLEGTVSIPTSPVESCIFHGDTHDCVLTIGEGVTRIPNYLFNGLTRLTAINFNAVNCANCVVVSYSNIWSSKTTENLTTVLTIGEGVTNLPAYLFREYTNLTGVSTLPNSVTSIGSNVFYGCPGITSLTIGANVTEFGAKAFGNCVNLAEVVLNATFTETPTLPSVSVGALFADDTHDCVVTIGEGVTRVPDKMFAGLSRVTTINFNATSCADCASDANSNIWGCKTTEGLATTLNIGDNVTNLPAYLFKDCANITSVNWGESLTGIGRNAFDGCENLAMPLVVPAGVDTVSDYAFNNCRSLTSILIHDDVAKVGEYAFYGCEAVTDLTIGADVFIFGKRAFGECTGLQNIVFNATLTNTPQLPSGPVYPYVFYNDITECTLTIGTGVTQLPKSMFAGLTNVTALNYNATSCADVPSGIGSVWGSREGSATELAIGSNVTYIPAYLFNGYSSMASVSIGGNVTGIGTHAFYNCSGIGQIYSNMMTPPTVVPETWYNVTRSIPFYIPAGTLATYQAAAVWQEFTNYIEFNGLTITVAANPEEGGTVTGGGLYASGVSCTVTATPNENYTFVNWTLNGEEVSTEASYTFTVTEAADYVANFEYHEPVIPTFEVVVSAEPAEMGEVSGGGIYNEGEECTITAEPYGDVYFVCWTENGEVVSEEPTYTFTVTENHSFVAHFEVDGVIENSIGKVMVYPNPATDRIVVDAQGDISLCDIYDMSGAKVLSVSGCSATMTISVGDLPKGAYILQVTGSEVNVTFCLIKK